jgi:hypothetical protein
MTGLEIAAVAGLAGTAMSALGAIQQGQAQKAALNANAAQQRQAGHNEVLAGEAEAARVQDQARRRAATGRNQLAGSGIDSASGSADDLLSDLAAGSALDASIARWRGSQAKVARGVQAGFLEAEGAQAAQAGWWRAGSTLLTAGGRMFAGSGGGGGGGQSLSDLDRVLSRER